MAKTSISFFAELQNYNLYNLLRPSYNYTTKLCHYLSKFYEEKKSPWMQFKTYSNLQIYERWICCSNSSIVVFPPCNSNVHHRLESVFFLNILQCSVYLPGFQTPHNVRTQLWNILYCHSDHSFSFTCRSERAFSHLLIQMKAPSKPPEAKRGFAINVTGFWAWPLSKELTHLTSLLVSSSSSAALFFLTELGNLEALQKKRFCMLREWEHGK